MSTVRQVHPTGHRGTVWRVTDPLCVLPRCLPPSRPRVTLGTSGSGGCTRRAEEKRDSLGLLPGLHLTLVPSSEMKLTLPGALMFC